MAAAGALLLQSLPLRFSTCMVLLLTRRHSRRRRRRRRRAACSKQASSQPNAVNWADLRQLLYTRAGLQVFYIAFACSITLPVLVDP